MSETDRHQPLESLGRSPEHGKSLGFPVSRIGGIPIVLELVLGTPMLSRLSFASLDRLLPQGSSLTSLPPQKKRAREIQGLQRTLTPSKLSASTLGKHEEFLPGMPVFLNRIPIRNVPSMVTRILQDSCEILSTSKTHQIEQRCELNILHR